MCVHFRALVPEGQSVTGARHGGARVSQCQGASSHGKNMLGCHGQGIAVPVCQGPLVPLCAHFGVRVLRCHGVMVPVELLNICFLLSGVYAGLIFFLWAGSF